MYPITIDHMARILPRHLMTGTVGWMAACSVGGSALLPFITSTMALNLGIEICAYFPILPLKFFQTQPKSFSIFHP